jgi:hypothetical protein
MRNIRLGRWLAKLAYLITVIVLIAVQGTVQAAEVPILITVKADKVEVAPNPVGVRVGDTIKWTAKPENPGQAAQIQIVVVKDNLGNPFVGGEEYDSKKKRIGVDDIPASPQVRERVHIYPAQYPYEIRLFDSKGDALAGRGGSGVIQILQRVFPELPAACNSKTVNALIDLEKTSGRKYIEDVPNKAGEKGILFRTIDDKAGNKADVWCLLERKDARGQRIHGGPDLALLYTPKGGKGVWVGACTLEDGFNFFTYDYDKWDKQDNKAEKFTKFRWRNRQNDDGTGNEKKDFEYEYDVKEEEQGRKGLTITRTKGKYVTNEFPDPVNPSRTMKERDYFSEVEERQQGGPIKAPEDFKDLKLNNNQLTLESGDRGIGAQPVTVVLSPQSPPGRFEYALVTSNLGGSGAPEDPVIGVRAMVKPGDVLTIAGAQIRDPFVTGLASQIQFGGWVVDDFNDTFVSFKVMSEAEFHPGFEVTGFGFLSDGGKGQVRWGLASTNEFSGSSGVTFGPANSTVTGSANRVGLVPPPGKDAAAQVRILVKFTTAAPANLGASTVTIDSLLNERGGAGELVKGTDGVNLLPMTLFARPGSTPTAAIFETPSRAIPKVRLEVQTKGQNLFDWLLRVDRGTIPAFPELCTGGSRLTTNLLTQFTIDDGINPPVPISTVQPWRCLDLVGIPRVPPAPAPRSLRAP